MIEWEKITRRKRKYEKITKNNINSYVNNNDDKHNSNGGDEIYTVGV